jgi:hypothetical protein
VPDLCSHHRPAKIVFLRREIDTSGGDTDITQSALHNEDRYRSRSSGARGCDAAYAALPLPSALSNRASCRRVPMIRPPPHRREIAVLHQAHCSTTCCTKRWSTLDCIGRPAFRIEADEQQLRLDLVATKSTSRMTYILHYLSGSPSIALYSRCIKKPMPLVARQRRA